LVAGNWLLAEADEQPAPPATLAVPPVIAADGVQVMPLGQAMVVTGAGMHVNPLGQLTLAATAGAHVNPLGQPGTSAGAQVKPVGQLVTETGEMLTTGAVEVPRTKLTSTVEALVMLTVHALPLIEAQPVQEVRDDP